MMFCSGVCVYEGGFHVLLCWISCPSLRPSWVRQCAPSLAGQRHCWSPGFELLLFTLPPLSSEFQQVWEEVNSVPSGCSVRLFTGVLGARWLHGQCLTNSEFPCQRALHARCHISTGGWNSPCRECDQICCSLITACPLKHDSTYAERFRPAALPACVPLGVASNICSKEGSCRARCCCCSPHSPGCGSFSQRGPWASHVLFPCTMLPSL